MKKFMTKAAGGSMKNKLTISMISLMLTEEIIFHWGGGLQKKWTLYLAGGSTKIL